MASFHLKKRPKNMYLLFMCPHELHKAIDFHRFSKIFTDFRISLKNCKIFIGFHIFSKKFADIFGVHSIFSDFH